MITKGALLGDSIVSNMYNNAHDLLQAGGNTITKLAVAGNKISDQLTIWQASAVRGDSSYDWIFLMVGINDVLNTTPSATALAQMDTFLADIHANNPGAHLFFDIMDPAKSRLDMSGPSFYPVWQTINAGYVARGAINTISIALNDGADSLAAIYQSGDGGLHPNTLGDRTSATNLLGLVSAVFPDPPPDPPPPFAPNYWQRPYRRGAW